MVYREFMDLTDDEIKYIIKDIFPYTSKIDNIIRDPQFNQISCDIYIMEEYPDIPDTLDLMVPAFGEEGITTHDFSLTDKELWKWKQFLLAKGCDERLKDNPYLEFDETDISKRGNHMHVNIFETKSDEELVELYKQFLEAEKSGGFPNDTELGIIKKQYENDFGANTVIMLQIELTHSIADRWYNEKFSI